MSHRPNLATARLCKKSFIETDPCSFAFLSPVAALWQIMAYKTNRKKLYSPAIYTDFAVCFRLPLYIWVQWSAYFVPQFTGNTFPCLLGTSVFNSQCESCH